MNYTRQKIVDTIKSWIGFNENDGTHKIIVDIYNSIKPLPNGYKLSYSDSWCMATVSACFHICGYDALFPLSYSCGDAINKAKKMGIWVESDAYVPQIGDVIIYAWKDPNPKADNTSGHDHTGIVTKIVNNTIAVTEGNYKDSVKVRTVSVNGKNIRGYIVPKYSLDTMNTRRETLKIGSKNSDVVYLHTKLFSLHYGVSKTSDYFDDLTKTCVIHFQKVNGLETDGIVGEKTWEMLERY